MFVNKKSKDLFNKYKDMPIPGREDYAFCKTIGKMLEFYYRSGWTFREPIKTIEDGNKLTFIVGGENQISEEEKGLIYSVNIIIVVDINKGEVINWFDRKTGKKKHMSKKELWNYL